MLTAALRIIAKIWKEKEIFFSSFFFFFFFKPHKI